MKSGAATTEGVVIHRAGWYDLFDRLAPFMRALRETIVEVAAPVPGERALGTATPTSPRPPVACAGQRKRPVNHSRTKWQV